MVGVSSLLIYLGSKSLPGMDWDLVKDKGNAYECGYSDLSELGCLYSLQFYVIGLSFMIFDLEVLLILPILVSLATLTHSILLAGGFLGFILVLLFLEIKVGVLDW
uniref:NADH-ubiquinone oxidoreductase chain 3 n=1 Tax=Doliolum nationalis TaxID=76841 RepID=Q5KT44_DOLNA|nr:NADH dehydrogenase subunit 3 [Doliolum nationalis]